MSHCEDVCHSSFWILIIIFQISTLATRKLTPNLYQVDRRGPAIAKYMTILGSRVHTNLSRWYKIGVKSKNFAKSRNQYSFEETSFLRVANGGSSLHGSHQCYLTRDKEGKIPRSPKKPAREQCKGMAPKIQGKLRRLRKGPGLLS